MAEPVPADELRGAFAAAMSAMYRAEVPQYGALLDLVADINRATLARDPALAARLDAAGELDRLGAERHGAIRLGTAEELAWIRRLFEVMGMRPVGYYDLSAAGIPVHSTAFRPTTTAALSRNPFRIFTSLLRLDRLDPALAGEATRILARRDILGDRLRRMIERAEVEGGLDAGRAESFLAEAVRVFRWQRRAPVDAGTYARLHAAHRLIADVVCFPGPHINHLTPRTLDIDAAQARMPERGIAPKAVIEGPPRRAVPILLRQTSFMALKEPVVFAGAPAETPGSHTARFGEIEQRGAALTPKGRALYDELLAATRAETAEGEDYETRLERHFRRFPDDLDTLRREGLVHVRYTATSRPPGPATGVEALLRSGALACTPQVYEDFLPISAAGIFRSNLGSHSDARQDCIAADRQGFERALDAPVVDEMDLYARIEAQSLRMALDRLGRGSAAPGG